MRASARALAASLTQPAQQRAAAGHGAIAGPGDRRSAAPERGQRRAARQDGGDRREGVAARRPPSGGIDRVGAGEVLLGRQVGQQAPALGGLDRHRPQAPGAIPASSRPTLQRQNPQSWSYRTVTAGGRAATVLSPCGA